MSLYDRSVVAAHEALKQTLAMSFAPAPRLSLRDWSQNNIILPKSVTARPGKFRPLVYQEGIMDAFSDPRIRDVVVVKPTQVGYTALLEAYIAYCLEHDPSSLLFYLPTDDDLRRFHDDHFMPIVNNTAALKEIMRWDGEWNIRRTIKGSRVTFLSAAVAKNFQSHRARVLMIDEISSDAYDPSGKIKEDKVNAGMERTGSFSRRKHIIGGTPAIMDRCRVWSWFLRGDKRKLFVPDPKTGEMHDLQFGDRSTRHGLKWTGRDAESVVYRFPSGVEVSEREFDRNVLPAAKWIPTAKPEDPKIASFQFNALVSPMNGADWPTIVRKWLDAKDQIRTNPAPMRSFYNTVLGLPFEDFEAKKGMRSLHELEDLKEHYEAEVPNGVNFLTASVDVQSGDGGWFQVKIAGWGYEEKMWVIGDWVFKDKPLSIRAAWDALEEFLKKTWKTSDGRELRIQAVAVDTGGHFTQEAYGFCERNKARRFFPIKGKNNAKGKRSNDGKAWPAEVSVTDKGRVYMVDVDIIKDTMFRRLHGDKAAPNAIVFPMEPLGGARECDADYFKDLTKEKKEYVPGGTGYYWTKASGQEVWDTLIYNFAALEGLRAIPGRNAFVAKTGKNPEQLKKAAEKRANSGAPVKEKEPDQVFQKRKQKKPRARWGVR